MISYSLSTMFAQALTPTRQRLFCRTQIALLPQTGEGTGVWEFPRRLICVGLWLNAEC